jgi:hypothetical protein
VECGDCSKNGIVAWTTASEGILDERRTFHDSLLVPPRSISLIERVMRIASCVKSGRCRADPRSRFHKSAW